MSPGTIYVYKAEVRSFYRSFIIEIPKINNRGEKVAPFEQNLWHGFTKEEVNGMLRVCSLRDRAIILLISLSGLARQEIINLKRSDFQDIDNQNIATIRIRRKKVDQDFVTFCSPEATKTILQYLEQRTDKNPYLFIARKSNLYMPTEMVKKVLGITRTRIKIQRLNQLIRKYKIDTGTLRYGKESNETIRCWIFSSDLIYDPVISINNLPEYPQQYQVQ